MAVGEAMSLQGAVNKTALIPVTANFRLGVAAATGGIVLVYLASFLLGFFGIAIPFLHDNVPIGIGISLVIVVIAAMTLVWLYLEMLRLLSKVRSRR